MPNVLLTPDLLRRLEKIQLLAARRACSPSAKRMNTNSRGCQPTEPRPKTNSALKGSNYEPSLIIERTCSHVCRIVRPLQGRANLMPRSVGFTHGYSYRVPPGLFGKAGCDSPCRPAPWRLTPAVAVLRLDPQWKIAEEPTLPV